MKNITLILLLLLSFSCKDKVTKDNIIEINQAPGQTDPGDQNSDRSPWVFDGVTKIDSIGQTTAVAYWNLNEHAGSYHVFFIEDKKLVHQISLNHPKNNVTLRDLKADTEYTVLIKMMDKEGRLDTNEISMKFKTAVWPEFINTKSLKFNGSQNLDLASSNSILTSERFSISLWFKTTLNQSDKRLITFHSLDASAATAVSLGLENNKISYQYRDAFNVLKSITSDLVYNDGAWNHLTITHNGSWHTLYINGQRTFSLEDTFYGFGAFPASVASFSGMQKAYTGLIDEVSIWSSAIGAQDVQELYHNGSPFDLKQHRRSGVLTSWYRNGDLDTDTGSNINDVFGNFLATSSNLNSTSIVLDTAK